MKILELKLTNFRNHKKLHLDLDHEMILITGPNGVGKSNILEAINVLATGRSLRARFDKDLISYGTNFSISTGKIENSSGKYSLEIQVLKGDDDTNISSKKAKINKVAKSLTSFSGIFNSVIFSPEDLNIITGSPSERRRYIDSILVQTDKNYKRNTSAYVKAVRQRNKILEKISEEGRGWDEIGFWTKKCLEHGRYIQQKRAELFEYFNEKITGVAKMLNGHETKVEINYLKNEISEDRLRKHEQHEISARTTLVGPHRDDFRIDHKEHNLAEFGSRGEQRSLMLALKICEIGYIEDQNKERPVLLLDDIFSELDEKHRNSVYNIMDKQQTIITNTETPFYLSDGDKIHNIKLL